MVEEIVRNNTNKKGLRSSLLSHTREYKNKFVNACKLHHLGAVFFTYL